jgi:hypothetical protein
MSNLKKKQKRRAKQSEQSLAKKISAFFDKREKSIVIISIILGTIMSILLFDVKVSLGGDDCDYIVAAGDFWNNFTYPGHHGPLYPILLSPFVALFGMKLILLKSLSLICMMASLWLFYKSFRGLVSSIILIPALFLVCINPHVLFFASYTYSEALFMLMQALFFYLFSTYFRDGNSEFTFKKDWKKHLAIVLIIMGMGLTRTIGFCTIGVIILYFVIERRWKDLISIVGIFTLIFGVFYFLTPVIWPDSGSVHSFNELLAKNPYNVEQGTEDISGLIQRVINNSHIYLAGFLYKYLGLRPDLPLKNIPILSLVTYILFFVCLVSIFRKNKSLMFSGLYAGILLMASFVLLHTIWGQDRMMMVYYPYILLFLMGGIYYLLQNKRIRNLRWIYPVILAVCITGTYIHLKAKVETNWPVLQQNIRGNSLFGLTPDWENFIKMSRWSNANLDKNAVIASRKPTISYVYTGRRFSGIYRVPMVSIDDVIKQVREAEEQNIFLCIDRKKSLPSEFMPFIEYAFASQDSENFSINGEKITLALLCKIDKSLFNDDLIELLNANNTAYTLDHNAFLNQYVEDKNVSYNITSPDMLLKHIKDNNIKYLLLPKLRLYMNQNTGSYINTIHQYISYIQMKYPNSFRPIHSIGKEETCEIAEFVGN